MELLDHVALGVVAALICALLTHQAGLLRLGAARAGQPPELRLVLWLVAAMVAISSLHLLLGRNGSQDGLLAGDVRLRNLLGAALLVLTWAAAFVTGRVRHGRPDAAGPPNAERPPHP